jgi:hypothetical protein
MNVGAWLGILVYIVFQLALVVLAETCAQHYLEASSKKAALSFICLTKQPARKVVATSNYDQPPRLSQAQAC